MSEIVHASAMVVLAVFFSASIGGILRTISAVRTQRRMHKLILDHASNDPEIQQLLSKASRQNLSVQDIKKAREIIEDIAKSLSKREQVILEEGLQQNSTVGQKRYISSLLCSDTCPA